MKRAILMAAMAAACLTANAQPKPIYQDASQPIEQRVEDALARMTVEEKIQLIHANGGYCSGGVPRLGIPGNFPTDGPVGLRPEMYWSGWTQAGMSTDSCTAFPALVCLAATWNPEMGKLFGHNYSEEALYRNKNIILGPGVNIFRTPMNGRNFEYMGEDPYLVSRMAVAYIQGVQANITLDKKTIRGDEHLQVSLQLTNKGNRKGAEVV